MRLKIWVPTEVFFDGEITKIKAEAENGWFGILPRHIDFVTSLVPGILYVERDDHQSEYLAIDHGILVKCGPQVSISTRRAVRGADLGRLKEAVETQFRILQEKEQAVRDLEAKLEADLVKELIEINRYG